MDSEASKSKLRELTGSSRGSAAGPEGQKLSIFVGKTDDEARNRSDAAFYPIDAGCDMIDGVPTRIDAPLTRIDGVSTGIDEVPTLIDAVQTLIDEGWTRIDDVRNRIDPLKSGIDPCLNVIGRFQPSMDAPKTDRRTTRMVSSRFEGVLDQDRSR